MTSLRFTSATYESPLGSAPGTTTLSFSPPLASGGVPTRAHLTLTQDDPAATPSSVVCELDAAQAERIRQIRGQLIEEVTVPQDDLQVFLVTQVVRRFSADGRCEALTLRRLVDEKALLRVWQSHGCPEYWPLAAAPLHPAAVVPWKQDILRILCEFRAPWIHDVVRLFGEMGSTIPASLPDRVATQRDWWVARVPPEAIPHRLHGLFRDWYPSLVATTLIAAYRREVRFVIADGATLSPLIRLTLNTEPGPTPEVGVAPGLPLVQSAPVSGPVVVLSDAHLRQVRVLGLDIPSAVSVTAARLADVITYRLVETTIGNQQQITIEGAIDCTALVDRWIEAGCPLRWS
jgi:hypothetical protein